MRKGCEGKEKKKDDIVWNKAKGMRKTRIGKNREIKVGGWKRGVKGGVRAEEEEGGRRE